MNDVIPEQGLGPQNQKWRQWVERKITSLQRNMEQKFGADVNNSLSAVNSSMSRMARDIRFLAALKTYSVQSPEAVTVFNPTQTTLKYVKLVFTLTDPSTVTFSINATVSGRAERAASGTGVALPALFFTGDVYQEVGPVGPTHLFLFRESAQIGASVSAGVTAVANLDSTIGTQRTLSLAPGYYEIGLTVQSSGNSTTAGFNAHIENLEFSASVINITPETVSA